MFLALLCTTFDDVWFNYCARNWLTEVPVNICVDGQCQRILIYMDYQVMVSRTAPEIPEGAGVGWNDYSCWEGDAMEVECE
jgi:hypothetical protein